MRILHVQKASGVGGSERHLLALLPVLGRRSVQARLCVLAAEGSERFLDLLRGAGVDHVVVPAGPDLDPRLVGRIARQIKVFEPDLVHTHLIHADVYGQGAARLAGVPAVSSVHGTLSFYSKEPFRTVARAAGRLAARTIAISEHVRAFIATHRLAPTARVRVVRYGIAPAKWVPDADEREAFRARLGIDPAEVVVGIASRLVAHKGHDFLIDAVAKALPEAPHLRLVVAGDGPLRSQLERYAVRRLPPGIARFIGYLHDVRAFMAGCEVVAFPTLAGFGEGFGLAALEAMAAARPVVATRLHSLPEIVLEAETGFLVDPGDVDAFATRLASLAQDDGFRTRLGARARERVCETFTLDEMADGTLAVYNDVLGAVPRVPTLTSRQARVR